MAAIGTPLLLRFVRGGEVIQRKKGLWRGEGGVNEEIETGKAED